MTMELKDTQISCAISVQENRKQYVKNAEYVTAIHLKLSDF
jgi:hypothetical protein